MAFQKVRNKQCFPIILEELKLKDKELDTLKPYATEVFSARYMFLSASFGDESISPTLPCISQVLRCGVPWFSVFLYVFSA